MCAPLAQAGARHRGVARRLDRLPGPARREGTANAHATTLTHTPALWSAYASMLLSHLHSSTIDAVTLTKHLTRVFTTAEKEV